MHTLDDHWPSGSLDRKTEADPDTSWTAKLLSRKKAPKNVPRNLAKKPSRPLSKRSEMTTAMPSISEAADVLYHSARDACMRATSHSAPM